MYEYSVITDSFKFWLFHQHLILFTSISIVTRFVSGASYSKAVKADGFSIFPFSNSIINCTIPPCSWSWWIPNGANEAQAILCCFISDFLSSATNITPFAIQLMILHQCYLISSLTSLVKKCCFQAILIYFLSSPMHPSPNLCVHEAWTSRMTTSECPCLLANIRYLAWQLLFLDCLIQKIILLAEH